MQNEDMQAVMSPVTTHVADYGPVVSPVARSGQANHNSK